MLIIVVLALVVLTATLLPNVKSLIFSSAAGLPGDADGNGKVDIVDIGIIIDNYAKSPIPNRNADINGDGKVDIVDIGITIDNYGKTGTGGGGGGNSTYDQVNSWIDAYGASHPGKAGDVTAKSPQELAADSAAKQIGDICGPDQRPVIPKLSWEYGGNDHPWINPGASALVYCVYIPVKNYTSHWKYDPGMGFGGRVYADVYVKFPDQNPCKSMSGKDQIISCLGDPTNSEILVDTASLNDGIWAGVPNLSEASTILYLIMPDGSKVELLLNI